VLKKETLELTGILSSTQSTNYMYNNVPLAGEIKTAIDILAI
jgi:hypothetical protein